MTALELVGVLALVFGGSTVFFITAVLLTNDPNKTKPCEQIESPRDLMSLYLLGKWYAERQEALADEVVSAMHWDHDPSSPEAEICREVVLCGRHPEDAKRRLQEIRGTL